MLHRVDQLRSYTLHSSDGELGKVHDIYFDDQTWTVRYLVIDTGGWLIQKRVLISPLAVNGVNADDRTITTELTKEQVEKSPTPDEEAPVSRQFEIAYNEYYDYSHYWVGPLGQGAYTAPLTPQDAARLEERESWDPHLYAAADMAGGAGYSIAAADGDLGHISDLVVSDEDWAVRYLVVDTRNWLPGKHVLLPPRWVDVDWENIRVSVDLARDIIKGAPDYDSDKPITRAYEEQLYGYYCRETYWSDNSACYDRPQ
jgi:sporulation protein YlmC with PRC-barrel domain